MSLVHRRHATRKAVAHFFFWHCLKRGTGAIFAIARSQAVRTLCAMYEHPAVTDMEAQ